MEIADPSPASPLTSIWDNTVITCFCNHRIMGLAPYICEHALLKKHTIGSKIKNNI
jgi:hypothetical protein